MVRATLVGAFLIGAPLLLAASLKLTLSSPSQPAGQVLGVSETLHPEPQAPYIFSSLPEHTGSIDASIIAGDARVLILEKFLNQYRSPLAEYSTTLVEAADTHDLDFRLLPAIAMQESGGCKVIPHESNNCWGWGIHERGTLRFSSMELAINTVAEGLQENYLQAGLQTPEEIMSKYTPSSPGTWAFAVRHFMAEME